MTSSKPLYYTLTALTTALTAYLLTRRPGTPTPPTLKGAANCKYPLDDTHSSTFTLPDGRQLGFAQYGDPNGRAVLYQHGIPGSRIEACRYDALGWELGVRIVSVGRPGYGLSSGVAGYRDRTVAGWAEDVERLVEFLGIQEYAVLGISGGGPYALSLAHGLPKDKLKVVSLVCGIGPSDIGMSGAAWPTYTGFTVGWRWSPQIFLRWFFQRDAAARLDLSDDERLAIFLSPSRLDGLDEKDKAFFADEDEMRVYLATSRQSFKQGFDGMCKDGFVMCTDWGFRIEDIRKDVPVVLWYGSRDVNVPPNHGRTIAKRLRTEDEAEDGEVSEEGPLEYRERVRLRMLDDTHASISMRDKRGYLVDILEAWGH